MNLRASSNRARAVSIRLDRKLSFSINDGIAHPPYRCHLKYAGERTRLLRTEGFNRAMLYLDDNVPFCPR